MFLSIADGRSALGPVRSDEYDSSRGRRGTEAKHRRDFGCHRFDQLGVPRIIHHWHRAAAVTDRDDGCATHGRGGVRRALVEGEDGELEQFGCGEKCRGCAIAELHAMSGNLLG